MSAEQLAFFPFRKPLLDLLGAEFFQQIPRAPGVYTFLSDAGKVLYVGQSKDLRSRLAYYKNARPDREPRRILRMIGRARTIQFELCPGVPEAQARELALIRQHRPTYNRALNGNPRHPFIALAFSSNTVAAQLLHFPDNPPGDLFGAFRGFGRCRQLLHALGRLSWCAQHPQAAVYDLPLSFSHNSRATELAFPFSGAPAGAWHEYLSGTREALTPIFAPSVETVSDPHLQTILADDLLLLREFFTAGPEFNHQLTLMHGLSLPIPPHELDALRLRFRSRRAPALAQTPSPNQTETSRS